MSRIVSTSVKLGKSLAAKAVHVIIDPQPRTLHESRQVLRVLKDFGEIVMFRSLRFEPFNSAPNSVLAMYQTSEAASKLLAASPLRFVATPPSLPLPVTSTASFGIPRVFNDQYSYNSKHRENDSTQTTTSDNLPLSESVNPREFHLRADKSFADHQGHIARQEYYWGFVRNTKYIAHEQLSRSVPLEGLASISANQTALHNRLVKKNLDDLAARKSLRHLWIEGCKAPP